MGMQLAQNPSGYKTIHILAEDGGALCKRLPMDTAIPVPSTATPDCRWCVRRAERAAQDERKHVGVMLCKECGEPWPCPSFPDENPDRCRAVTSTGRPCTRRPAQWSWADGFCHVHMT